jgi:peptidyl-prolyl cis-trans isomerase SurA
MNTASKILLIVIGAFFVQHRLMAQTQQGKLLDKVIASVDDQPILQSELEAEYQLYQAQGNSGIQPTKCQILENMVINKILLANASKKDIYAKNEEVERYLNYRMEVILKEVGTEAKLEEYTQRSIHLFKEELRKTIKEQLTIEKMRDTIIGDITISPIEVQTYFDQLKPNEVPFFPATVEAYHLVLFPTIKEQEKEVVIETLASLKRRIQAGDSFAVFAHQHSEDPGSAGNGGELGFWKIGELDPSYEKAALALNPGEISDPVETRFGFHIIQLIERQKDKYNTRHILLKPRAVKATIEEAIERLNNIRTSILEKQITFEKAAMTYSQDIVTSHQGGLLTGNSGEGVQMPVDKLPSDLFFILDKMVPGAVSQPIVFTVDDKQAARIIYLKERIASHQANLEQDYEKIYKSALVHKKQRALNEWVEAAKAKAIIQLAPTYEACKILQ